MNQAIIRVIVVVLGVAGALLLSTILADANFFFILITAVAMAGLAFVAVFWRYALVISWLFVFVGFSWYPAGINISWEELGYLAPLALLILTIWRLPDRAHELPSSSQSVKRLLILATFIWAVYITATFGWRLLEVRSYGEPGLKNVIKSYATIIVPAFLTVYYASRPALLNLPKNPERFFLLALAAGTALNICTRSFQNFFGGAEFDFSTNSFLVGPLIIHGINLVESIYALRVICPLATLFGVLILTRPGVRGTSWFLPALCVFLGLAGSLLGGGRATLVICGATVAAVFMIRKWHTVLFVSAIATISFVLLVNVFSREIEDIGGNVVSRSVSWLIFIEGTSAQGDIEASTRWRRLVFSDALDVWLASPRNFLIGRGYRGFSETDYQDIRQMDYYEAIRIAVQRGASHSLISDTLLVAGLLGLALYYATIILGIWLGWRIAHEKSLSVFTRDLGWALCFVLGQRITIGSISGGLNSMTLDFLLLTTIFVSANRDINLPSKSLETGPIPEAEESTYAGVA